MTGQKQPYEQDAARPSGAAQESFVPVYQPVDQDRFWDPEQPHLRGNCTQAVVASLTGVDLDCVPHFVQLDVDGHGSWDSLLDAWLAERGLCAVWWFPQQESPLPPWDGYVAIYGPSPRDPAISHIVISHRGRIVHDPHPDRTGITYTKGCWWLMPLPGPTTSEGDQA